MTQRPIDHLVHCVGDLEAARAFHQRLGFTMTPPARHPFGTGNSLIQLDGNFVELVAIVDPAAIRPAASGHFSFGHYNAEFLERGRGLSMLVFASDDARRDHADFMAKGLQTYEPFDFSRKAKLPDGGEVTVAFSLAFVTHPDLPQAVFFVCQQHAPQYFWKPEYQRHANTAAVVDAVIMSAEEPAALADFFGKLQGERNVTREKRRLTVETGRGSILVLDRAEARARFPDGTSDPTPHFVGYRVLVRDLDAAERVLRDGRVPHHAEKSHIRIAAMDNFGAALELAPQR
jgi:hypothetical protein